MDRILIMTEEYFQLIFLLIKLFPLTILLKMIYLKVEMIGVAFNVVGC